MELAFPSVQNGLMEGGTPTGPFTKGRIIVLAHMSRFTAIKHRE